MKTRMQRAEASRPSLEDLSSADFGVFEAALATLRARKADALIPTELRRGRILDLGCGANLTFLSRVDFAMKVGADRPGRTPRTEGIHSTPMDFERTRYLPFRDGVFTVVTMLAVLEHIRPERVASLLADAYRVLAPDGVLVLTTPLPWTDPMLRAMARIRLLSKFHISDHERTYTKRELHGLLSDSPFPSGSTRVGTFELGANAWVTARKS